MNIDLKNYENKNFILFLVIHLLVWTSVALIRVIMPTDALEGIFWGSLHDFGTPKHPPLAGWLTYLAYAPFKSDFCVYLMSQLFIVAGFVYVYKLAKFFLDTNKAMISVILLEGCWVYSYITGYYGFNPDVILLFTLPAISYYFYKCVKFNKAVDWVVFGLLVGFAFLNKYQTALVIFAMVIWALWFKREVFKNKFLYLSIILAFLVFLPHLLWLFKYDFFPFMYFEGELNDTSWLNHITAPLMFLLLQIAVIAGSLLIYFIMKWKFKSPFTFIKNYRKEDFWYLILLGFVPLVVHLIMGFYVGGTMRPRWGFEFWFLTGVMLCYFIPTNIGKNEFKFVLKLAYTIMFIIFIAMGTLLSVEKNYRSRYPVKLVFEDLKTFWAQKSDERLKYVGGYLEWSLPLTIYGDTHPATILDTFGYKNPWIDEDDLKKSGALIIDRTKENVIRHTQKACAYLPQDLVIEPTPYKFTLTNAFNQKREYTVYYYIVEPIK